MPDATLTSEPDKNQPRTKVLRIADPQRTSAQVNTLLSILERCERPLHNSAEIGAQVHLNAEAEKAAELTYVLAMLQLRNIIDDMPRWQLGVSDGDKYVEKLAAQQSEIAEHQREILMQQSMPHRQLHPQLKRFDVGWIAWLGQGEQPRPGELAGVGVSPVDALRQFDIAFFAKLNRQPPPPAEPEAPPAPKPKRKR